MHKYFKISIAMMTMNSSIDGVVDSVIEAKKDVVQDVKVNVSNGISWILRGAGAVFTAVNLRVADADLSSNASSSAGNHSMSGNDTVAVAGSVIMGLILCGTLLYSMIKEEIKQRS